MDTLLIGEERSESHGAALGHVHFDVKLIRKVKLPS